MKTETRSTLSIPCNNHRFYSLPIAIVAQFFIASLAGASCSVTSPAATAHLVELYTSEGCSSCPPADRWLHNLPARDDVVALAFHVDYWDSLGWRDRFADPRFTDRQRAMAARSGSTTVYTPEVVLDGREWRRWPSAALPESSESAPIAMTLDVVPGNPLRASVAISSAGGSNVDDYVTYVALTEDGLSNSVKAGENRGELLQHDHVVRAFASPSNAGPSNAGPSKPAKATVELDAPADLVRAQASVVAFAQSTRDGSIGQVVRLPLATCPSS
ncbi:MAG: DUF1223 domain-containing protein [Dokdonella sp.]